MRVDVDMRVDTLDMNELEDQGIIMELEGHAHQTHAPRFSRC
jgi:hypothetical protein